MTMEEFAVAHPLLAGGLRQCAGNYTIDGVYLRDDGRWEAHCSNVWHPFQLALESRCHPNCHRASRVWMWAEHECCEQCIENSGHYYQTVHE